MNSNQFRNNNLGMPLLPTPQSSGQSLLEQQQKLQQQQQSQRTTLLSNPKAPLLGLPPDNKPKPLLGEKPVDSFSTNKTLLGSKPVHQEDLTPPGVSSNNRTLLGVKATKTLLNTPIIPTASGLNDTKSEDIKVSKTLLHTPLIDDSVSKHNKTLLSAPKINSGESVTMRTSFAPPPMPMPPPINAPAMPNFMPPPFAPPMPFVPASFVSGPGPGPPQSNSIFPIPPPGPAMQSILDASSYNAMQASFNPISSTAFTISHSTPTVTPTPVISSAPVSYKSSTSNFNEVTNSGQSSLFPSASSQLTSLEKANLKENIASTASSIKGVAVGESGLEIAERKFKAILEEEKEFESSCSEWMKQYHTWLKDNENHPNKKQFDTYKSEWTGYIDKMEKKRKEINAKKSSLKADLEKAADEEKRRANTAATEKMKEDQFAMLKQKIDHFKALMKQDNLKIPESVINRLNAASNPNASANSTPPISTDNKGNPKESHPKKHRRRSSSLSSGSSRSRSRSRSASRSKRRSRRRSRSHSSGSSRGHSRRSRDRYRTSRSRSRDLRGDSYRGGYRDHDDRYPERSRDYDYRVIPGTLPSQSASSSFDTGASEVIDYGHGKALGTRFVPGSKVQSFETWSPSRGSYFEGHDADHRYSQQGQQDFYGSYYSGPRGPHPRPFRPGWEHAPMQRFPGPRPPPGYPRMMRPPHPLRPRLPPLHMRARFPPGVRPPPHLMRPPMQSPDWSEPSQHDYYSESSYYEHPAPPVDYPIRPQTQPQIYHPPSGVPPPVQTPVKPPAPPPPPPPCEVVLLEDLLYPPGRDKRPENVFIIMRGLPGSGKTTMAKLIKNKELDNGGSAPRILNLDDFFMIDGIYEYDSSMKLDYEQNLFKAFKRQIDLGYFPFIILDCINPHVRDFAQYAAYAKTKDYTTYVLELELDPFTCSHRNIHNWKLEDIKAMEKEWEIIHSPFVKVNPGCLLKEIGIEEVEMEDVDLTEETEITEFPDADNEDEEEDMEDIDTIMKKFSASKWDNDTAQERLERLDGLKKVVHHEDSTQNLSEYLQIEDDRTKELNTTGQKRVRWADLEELKLQMKRKQLGFVVGQTDWSKITQEDDEVANQALNRTKYFTSDANNDFYSMND